MQRSPPPNGSTPPLDLRSSGHDIEAVGRLIGQATEEVFACMLERSVGALGVFWDEAPLPDSEVVVVVCMYGDIAGTISLHCSEAQAREFTRLMLRLPRCELTSRLTSLETVRDATSELVNMIAGEFRSRLGADLWVEMTLPFFVCSEVIRLRVLGDRGIVVHLDDSSGAFQVEVTLGPGEGAVDAS